MLEELASKLPEGEMKILNGKDAEGKMDALSKFRMANRKESGLQVNPKSVGSSRAFLSVKKPEDLKIDGQDVQVKTGIKLAYLGRFDSGKVKDGIKQNQNEIDSKFHGDHILQKQSDGSYKTNEHGILLPTLDHDKHAAHWIQTIHANPISHDNPLEPHTKTEDFPKGIHANDFELAMDNKFPKGDKIWNHPFVKRVLELKKKHGLKDIHSDNLGIFTHPVTGEQHLVVTDYGK